MSVYGGCRYDNVIKLQSGREISRNFRAARTVPVIAVKQLGLAELLAKALVEALGIWLPVPKA